MRSNSLLCFLVHDYKVQQGEQFALHLSPGGPCHHLIMVSTYSVVFPLHPSALIPGCTVTQLHTEAGRIFWPKSIQLVITAVLWKVRAGGSVISKAAWGLESCMTCHFKIIWLAYLSLRKALFCVNILTFLLTCLAG